MQIWGRLMLLQGTTTMGAMRQVQVVRLERTQMRTRSHAAGSEASFWQIGGSISVLQRPELRIVFDRSQASRTWLRAGPSLALADGAAAALRCVNTVTPRGSGFEDRKRCWNGWSPTVAARRCRGPSPYGQCELLRNTPQRSSFWRGHCSAETLVVQ